VSAALDCKPHEMMEKLYKTRYSTS